ncbi:hypothetical protein V2J09_003635 [Rumex salicifolius]
MNTRNAAIASTLPFEDVPKNFSVPCKKICYQCIKTRTKIRIRPPVFCQERLKASILRTPLIGGGFPNLEQVEMAGLDIDSNDEEIW